ncbi:MAG TPA: lipopolysaccharide heptosyltransferase family protein, partial [Alphaproteobacteria bacterium]|nr:lipopolysaccharide heptosyltransferase family protein [Alphaproteobacteria bacterium]
QYAGLFEQDDRVDVLHLLAGTGPGALLRLRRSLPNRFDALIDAHGVTRSALLAASLGAGRRTRIVKDQARKLLLIHRKINRYQAGGPSMVGRYVDLARRIGAAPPVDPPPRLAVPRTARDAAGRLLAGFPGDRPPIAVAPGARHDTKRWPRERFAELVSSLVSRGERIALVGGAGDREICRAVAGEAEGVVDCCGGFSPVETAAVLAGCALLVTNDSAPLHIAEAVGTPVVALFGPTVGQFGYAPRLPASVLVERTLECRPCSRNGARPCPLGTKECLAEIPSARVLKAVLETLEGIRGGHMKGQA